MRTLFAKTSTVAAAFVALAAQAQPIAAPGTEGNFVVASGGDIIATYEGTTASYTDLLVLLSPTNSLGTIFNNHGSAVGSTVDLGSFAAGTELQFELKVLNTGNTFFSGPASRNPDGVAHARVQADWKPGTTLVSFEDLYGDPEGVNGFNDLSFSFTNTTSSVTAPVPEPGTYVLMLAGLGVVGFVSRKRRRG